MNTLYPKIIQIGKQTKNILIPKLKKDSYIPIIIHNKNQIKKLKLYTLPSDFPKFNLDNKQDIKGYILTPFHGFKLIHPSYAMIIDTNGNLVWYRGNPIKVLSSFHLQQHNTNHKLRYSMHIQIDIDPKDNNLIISSASGYYIAKINKSTGKIMWKLGGIKDEFNLPDNYKFIRQHNAQVLDNNQIMLFDNGMSNLSEEEKLNNNIQEYTSRILKFTIDEKNKKVVDVTEIPIYEKARWMGSVQQLPNNNYFIGCGSAENCAAKLMDNDGNDIIRLTVQKPYFSYRAYFTERIKN